MAARAAEGGGSVAEAERPGGRGVRGQPPRWRRAVHHARRRVVDVVTYDILARQMSKPVRAAKQPLEGLEMRLVEPGSVKVRGGGAVLGDPIGAERMMRRGNPTRLWWAGTLDGEVIGRVIAIIPGPGERRGVNVLGRTLQPTDAYITGLWIDPGFRNRNWSARWWLRGWSSSASAASRLCGAR